MTTHNKVYIIVGKNLFVRFKFATHESATDFARDFLHLKDSEYTVRAVYE